MYLQDKFTNEVLVIYALHSVKIESEESFKGDAIACIHSTTIIDWLIEAYGPGFCTKRLT